MWQVWCIEDLRRPPRFPLRLPFQPPLLAEALARKDLCEWFCWLLEEAVGNKVGELFGAKVRWLWVWPKISFVLACRGAPH